MGKIYDLTVNILTIEKRVETGFHSLLQCVFLLKNSPNWTKLETGVGVNEIGINDLYKKIADINNLNVFRLLERFQSAALFCSFGIYSL